MIWNEHIECCSRDAMTQRQSDGLRKMVERLYFNVPFYRKKFQEMDLSPHDIRGIEDLHKLPFTYKQDLRDNYPMGLFAVPQSEIVRLHASSGTTGKQTVVGYTRKDLDMWSEVVARCFSAAGISKKDIVQIAYGYGLFTGGLGLHYGTEKVGASVIPISGGNTHRQLQMMQDLGSTVLACTPSYALYLAESLEKAGITREQTKLRVGIFGAEAWTNEMRKELEYKLGLKAFDIYGLSEIMGPGVACECECQNGLHVNEDHFIPEIIDPVTLDPLPEGQVGELVFTTITKEGLPLLRYRTRDLSALHYDTCSCGRTLVRMEKCKGRTDDMLIIRGVNVFPSQIESVLLNMHETSPHYQLIVDRVNNLDILEVHVEMDEHFFADEIRKIEDLNKRIKHNIENTLGISVGVKLVEPNTIEPTEGKAKRTIDNRKP